MPSRCFKKIYLWGCSVCSWKWFAVANKRTLFTEMCRQAQGHSSQKTFSVSEPDQCASTARFTELQSGSGWKGPLKVIWSKPPAQASPPKASCTGLCLDSFCVSSRMETTCLGNLCLAILTVKMCFLMFRRNILCFNLCLNSQIKGLFLGIILLAKIYP